jgi:hypothetical protein
VADQGIRQVAGAAYLVRQIGASASGALALAGLLSRAVWHTFLFHFGLLLERRGRALVETVFPFTAPTAERDIFEAVSFEEFWTWLLRHYLRPVHLNLARLHGMCDEQEQVHDRQ